MSVYIAEDNEALLLSILLSGSRKAYYETATVIDADDFESAAHRAIYRAIGRVAEKAHPQWLLVWQALGEDESLIADRGGKVYLSSLTTLAVSPYTRAAHVEALRTASARRRLRARLEQALLDPHITTAALAEDLYRLERRSIDGTTLHEALGRLRVQSQTPDAAGIPYPWQPIQALTNGLRPGWLCYLAGETSHGKTAAAIDFADAVATNGGTVLYVSLEMPATDIAMRIAQRRGISSGRVQNGRASLADVGVIDDLLETDWTKRVHLEFADKVERLPGLVLRHKPDLVVVDYIGLLDIGRETRLEGTNKNSRALKMLALRMNVPVVCLVQLSRAAAQERNKAPGLWRLRDSGQLENDADQVIFIWRKRDDNNQLTTEGALMVAKARNGQTGDTRMIFNGERQELRVSFAGGEG